MEIKQASMIIDYLGNDLEKIANEINKLKSIIKGNKILDLDIEKYIGLSRKYNNFEYGLTRGIVNSHKHSGFLGDGDFVGVNLTVNLFQ